MEVRYCPLGSSALLVAVFPGIVAAEFLPAVAEPGFSFARSAPRNFGCDASVHATLLQDNRMKITRAALKV